MSSAAFRSQLSAFDFLLFRKFRAILRCGIMSRIFKDRSEAGRLLAQQLAHYANRRDVLVLGLPRGGVPVAFEVARALHAPLDVYVVRKIGVPGHEELAMGAQASGNVRVVNAEVVRALHIKKEIFERVAEIERLEIKRREQAYRGNRPQIEAKDRIVILVDDGVATGSTMKAGVMALRNLEPAKIVAAAPTIAAATFLELRPEVTELVAVIKPEIFNSVGQWYEQFPQTSDNEVCALLDFKLRVSDQDPG